MRLPASLALLLLASGALAQGPLPTLEIGAGVSAISLPDYRGSANSSSYVLPFPYIKYRGDRLRVDGGARGIIFESEDVLLTLSADFTLPADDDNHEREGMDELDAIFEIGPALNYRFYPMQHGALWVDLPLRFGYTVNSDFEDIGYVFAPRLSWRKPATRLGESKIRLSIGPLFANNRYHDYFYSVDDADATATRPAYEADGGYSGLRSEFTYSKRIGRYWLGGFIRYDNMNGAVIDDSPLVSDDETWTVGIALAWVFYQR
jgi:outer membrane scaffolding protein for murein synthesis (MipA/OmpV family)